MLAALIGVPIVIVVAGTVGATAVFGSRCDLNALRPVAVGQNSFVYAANGAELGVIPAERNRTPVTRGEISPWVPKATVAIEDRRFYSHGGVDPVGIARAVVARLRDEVAGESDALVYVSSLNGNATVTIRAAARDEDDAQRLERELRVRAHTRLRALGVWG